ncbi:aldehyde dehydrogenase [Rhodococcus opacus]|nr:aldehyde dehydrogenase [Rhodococcus opacus]
MKFDVVESYSPQDPSDLVGECPVTPTGQVASAIEAARGALRDWSATPIEVRRAVLLEVADRLEIEAAALADLLIREIGKTRSEAVAEVTTAIDLVRYHADTLTDLDLRHVAFGDQYQPGACGVVGVIGSWVHPLVLSVSSIAAALAAGCAVVFKPSSQAISCAAAVRDTIAPALPRGVFTMLAGGARTVIEISRTVDHVAFTGSSQVAREIRTLSTADIPVRAHTVNPSIALVLPDADIVEAAQRIAHQMVAFAGQACGAPHQILAIGRPTSELEDALLAATASLRVGDPAETGTDLGPVISRRAQTITANAASQAAAAGATVHSVSATFPALGGWFVAPTVITGLHPEHPVARQRVLGPIAMLDTAADWQSACARMTARTRPYAAHVYASESAGNTELSLLDASNILVNTLPGMDFEFDLPGMPTVDSFTIRRRILETSDGTSSFTRLAGLNL